MGKYISAYLLHHNLHTFPHSQTTSGFRINLNSIWHHQEELLLSLEELEPSPHQRIMLEVLILPENSNGTLFSGLINQKRNSQDANAQARRESFNDMKPATGIIGKMWNNFTSGSPPK